MNKRIIAVDFDGTLFENKWPDIGSPIWPIIDAAKRARRAGAELILWTTREGDRLAEAVEACDKVGLHFDAINDNTETMKTAWGNNPRKVGVTEYWDDLSINPDKIKAQILDPSAGAPIRIKDVAFVVRNYRGFLAMRVGSVSEIYYTDDMRLAIAVKGAGRGLWLRDVFPNEELAAQEVKRRKEARVHEL